MQVTSKRINKNTGKSVVLEMLAQLSYKQQMEIYRRLSQWLDKKSIKPMTNKFSHNGNNEFFQTEFGQYILEKAGTNISITKVRTALAKIKGSLSQDVIAEREER